MKKSRCSTISERGLRRRARTGQPYPKAIAEPMLTDPLCQDGGRILEKSVSMPPPYFGEKGCEFRLEELLVCGYKLQTNHKSMIANNFDNDYADGG